MYRYLLVAMMTLTQGCTASAWQNFATPPAQQTVEARKFVLIDANGKPLAELGATREGSGLVLMDSTGKPRAALVVTGAGQPGLKLYDRSGVVRAALIVADDGHAGLALYDTASRNRAALATNPDGASALMLFDRDGRLVGVLPARLVDEQRSHGGRTQGDGRRSG